MGVRKTTTVEVSTVGVTYLPNAMHTLRALFIRIDERGNSITIDLPIIGWVFSADTPPMPVVPGGVPKQTQLALVRDEHTGAWFNPQTGESFSEFKEALRPLYADYDKRPKPDPAPEAITVPAVGGVGLAAGNWPGQPLPWKAGR